MTHFDHLLDKFDNYYNDFFKGLQGQYEACLKNIELFEKATAGKYARNNTLQSICEDEADQTSRCSTDSASTVTSQSILKENESANNKELIKKKPSINKTTDMSDKENDSSQSERAASPISRPRKRSKEDMQETTSPETGKRHKRSASAKAIANINKQLNVNLNQKLRRPDPEEDKKTTDNKLKKTANTKDKHDEKEMPVVKVKVEKMSIVDEQPGPQEVILPTNVEVKSEPVDALMPPPPVPRPRRGVTLSTETQEVRRSTRGGRKKNVDPEVAPEPSKRSTRNSSRATEEIPPPPADVKPKRTKTRKGQKRQESCEEMEDQKPIIEKIEEQEIEPLKQEEPVREKETTVMAPPAGEARPKRTRGIKKQKNVDERTQDQPPTDSETQITEQPEKSRPKRTRKVKKASTENQPKEPEANLKVPDSNPPQLSSPILPTQPLKKLKKMTLSEEKLDELAKLDEVRRTTRSQSEEPFKGFNLEDQENAPSSTLVGAENANAELAESKDTEKETKTSLSEKCTSKPPNGIIRAVKEAEIEQENLDKTVLLPRHSDANVPKNPAMNETIVLQKASCTPPLAANSKPALNETVVISKAPCTPKRVIMNETVTVNGNNDSLISNDESLMTDDSSHIQNTPVQESHLQIKPTSAVKEKVHQFEQLAAGRVTRTKTRAISKQLEQINTLPVKHILSASTLAQLAHVKQNGLLLKPNQMQSSSAVKPRQNIVTAMKSFLPASASKVQTQLNATQKAEDLKTKNMEKEDAIRKKEALLEAKREEQKRRREQKMANAAAAREAAARERERALAAAARDRQERAAQHHDLKEAEKQKEIERKRQMMEKKAAEIEERRRADEAARLARLEEEQRKAEAARKKLMEQERIKKEAILMEREMQAATQQYLAKEKEKLKLQQMKQRMEADRMHTSMTAPGTPAAKMAPVHMADGFEYMNSDSEEEDKQPKRTPPEWSTRAARNQAGYVQLRLDLLHIDRLFSVQKHSPDLTELFPSIDRRVLKRTSSAVWHTPPRLTALHE